MLGRRDAKMNPHVAVAGGLQTQRTEVNKSPSAWTGPMLIAVLALVAIFLHLALRYGFRVPRIAWQAPLMIALMAGGLPLLVRLSQKLLQREFGADHLAGVSIITSVILG